MSSSTIDYDALAQQHGGKATATSQVDYDSLASQQGGKASATSAQPTQPSADTGILASLKRTGGGIIHLPGTIYDAVTKPPQNADEEKMDTMGGRGALALQRLVADPMVKEHVKAEQLRQLAATQTPEQATNAYSGTQHLANMHDIASIVPVVGPMSADMVERFLRGDKSGAVTDLATNVAGPKIAEGVAGAAISGLNKAFPGATAAERLYQSALKPSTTLSLAERANVVRTGLDAGIPVSAKGVDKLSGLISDLNDKVKAQIQAGSAAGATVEPTAVAARADQIKARFANQVNPKSDLAAIESAKQEFLENNPQPMSAADAQAMKQGTYAQLKGKAYGELKSATIEAQKALARGIKEELQTQFPEIKGLNAQEARLIDLDGVLERAVNRIGNHQLMGIGTPIAAAGTGAVIGHPGSAALAAGGLKAILDNPIVKSKLAIALNKAGRGTIPLAAANAKVAQFVNALAQSQSAAGASGSDSTQ